MKEKLIYWLVPAVIGLAIFGLAADARHCFDGVDREVLMRGLSDACLLPGVLLAGAAALNATAYWGTWDLLGFSWQKFKGLFTRDPAKSGAKDLYTYRQGKAERRFKLWNCLLVGCAFLALAILFAILS